MKTKSGTKWKAFVANACSKDPSIRTLDEKRAIAIAMHEVEPGYHIMVDASDDLGPEHDLGEGPWDSLETAEEFLRCEVGVSAHIVLVK